MKHIDRRNLCLCALFTAFLLSIGSMHADEISPGIYRTPDERFANLVDFPYQPNYLQIGDYRIHYDVRLGVEGVHLRRTAGHPQVDDALGFGSV